MLLELEIIDTTGTMRMSFAQAMRHPFELEEGMTVAFSSVREQVLDDANGDNEIAAVRLWGVDEGGGELKCAAIQFDLSNGQQIFVDPTYHFGIRVGGAEQKKIWMENLPDGGPALQHVLSR